jgi:hypothetical protein
MRAKHIIGNFQGFFEELFDTQIVLSRAKSNFGTKTSRPLEKPREIDDYGSCFASIQ